MIPVKGQNGKMGRNVCCAVCGQYRWIEGDLTVCEPCRDPDKFAVMGPTEEELRKSPPSPWHRPILRPGMRRP